MDKLFCINSKLELIKKKKFDFVEQLIHLNIRYSVIQHISSYMNEAIKEIEQYNVNKEKSKKIADNVIAVIERTRQDEQRT